jgi:hypothetical protein
MVEREYAEIRNSVRSKSSKIGSATKNEAMKPIKSFFPGCGSQLEAIESVTIPPTRRNSTSIG